jgi:hypothetical protein
LTHELRSQRVDLLLLLTLPLHLRELHGVHLSGLLGVLLSGIKRPALVVALQSGEQAARQVRAEIGLALLALKKARSGHQKRLFLRVVQIVEEGH